MSVQKRQKTESEPSFCRTSFVECKNSQIWKIEGFLTKCPLVNGEFLESSEFNVAGCKSNFNMRLYPKGDAKDVTDVSLYIYIDEGNPKITCEFSLVDISGTKVYKRYLINSTMVESKGFGYKHFISRDILKLQNLILLPDDDLIVSCVVIMCSELKVSSGPFSGSSASGNTVVDDLASLFERKEGADVLLKVGDDSIAAHKNILMCRSPVFSAMFKSDMREGITGEVQVSDIDRDVLLALLTFLYSDRLSVPDVEFAIRLLVAADKYAVQLLQSRCAQYLAENLSTANVFDVLLVADACHCKELSQKCASLIKKQMPITDVMTQLDGSPHLIGVFNKHLNPE